MNHFDVDLDDVDFLDEVKRRIENDYGRSLARIAKFQAIAPLHFEIIGVFTDFKIIDAEIRIFPDIHSTVIITGIYH